MTAEQKAAQEFIEKYWDGKLPMNLLAMCKKAGIAVYAHDFSDSTQSETGLDKGQACIRIRRDLTTDMDSVKVRFILAHCIGHIEMHRDQLRELSP